VYSRISLLALFAMACGPDAKDAAQTAPPVPTFLKAWEAEALPAWQAWQEAEWEANTRYREGNPKRAERAERERKAWEEIVGDPKWIQDARRLYWQQRKNPNLPAAHQASAAEMYALKAIDRLARFTTPKAQAERETMHVLMGRLARTRASGSFNLGEDGVLNPAQMAQRYADEPDVETRALLWEAMYRPAQELEASYIELRSTLNDRARAAGWPDHLPASMHRLNLEPAEIQPLADDLVADLWPLYRELHTHARYSLAEAYGLEEVPEQLPVHWLNDPVGRNLSDVASLPSLNEGLQRGGTQKMLQDAATFQVTLGLPDLAPSFWTASDLYPRSADATEAKTSGTYLFAPTLDENLRLLAEATATPGSRNSMYRALALAEARTVQAYMGIPAAIRTEAPGPLHQALRIWTNLLANRGDQWVAEGLVDTAPDPILVRYNEAFTYVPMALHSAAVAFPFERQLFEDQLSREQLVTTWWDLKGSMMGQEAPDERSERWSDPLVDEQLTLTPGRSIENAFAVAIAFQLHMHASKEAGVDPYTGQLAGTEAFVKTYETIARLEFANDWRKALKAITGEEPSGDALMEYFEPVFDALSDANEVRQSTLPSAP